MASRINVSLDGEQAAKLAALAERMHINEGTLAGSLLAAAIDGADPDAAHITALLDRTPGAFGRTHEGIAQARRGEGIPLSDLA